MVAWRERCQSFGLAILNPKEKTLFGRTCKSWTQIFVYYCVFYTVLASFWIGMLSVLIFGLIEVESPARTGMQSWLKLNPGLSLIPRVKDEAALIQVNTFESKQKNDYLNYVQEYLSKYPDESSNCDFETGQRKSGTVREPCEFSRSLLGPCADPATFLQDNDNACFYIKLNKIYGYLPDVEGTKIHVKCGAANRFGRQYLGEVLYYPTVMTSNGTFEGYFSTVAFPYLNQPDYQTPLLAVVFPNIKRNMVIMITCKISNLANTEEFRFDVAVDTKPSIAFA